jgi:tetratricopeptide (TPR) repeat protein
MSDSRREARPSPLLSVNEMTSDAVEESRQESKAKVFISYSRKDIAFADRLVAALTARGFEPLIDRTDIYAFEEWWSRVEALIARADTVVFVLSPDAVRPGTVALKEVDFAASLNKRFAPIIFRPVDDKSVPEVLAKLNFIFFDDEAQFDASADRLAEALNNDIGWIRQHTDFGEQARRWGLAKGATGLLLRAPVLEQAERWIAARPSGAPAPTEETQAFIRRSRQATTRRRNILTSSLAAGLVLALGLAGLAYWQRGIALEQEKIAQEQRRSAEEQRQIADEQRKLAEEQREHARQQQSRAEHNFSAAQDAARALVFDLAHELRNNPGMPQKLIASIVDRAEAVLKKLTETAPDEPSLLGLQVEGLFELGETLEKRNAIDQALTAYKQSREILDHLTSAFPEDTDWQVDLAVADNRLGNLLLYRNDLGGAALAFKAANAIRERLAMSQPSNPDWQFALAISRANLGQIQLKQRDYSGAIKTFLDSQTIVKRLADADPTNLRWQDQLFHSYKDLGDAMHLSGDLVGALSAYREYNAIVGRLIAKDPDNNNLKSNLATSYDDIGKVLEAQDKLNDALNAYLTSQTVWEQLAIANLDAAQLQLAMAVHKQNIGMILVKLEDFKGAVLAFIGMRSLLESLAEADPKNITIKEKLFTSYFNLALAMKLAFAFGDSLHAYNGALKIIRELIVIDPSNNKWKQELASVDARIGSLLRTSHDFIGALAADREALAVIQQLVNQNPDDDELQENLLLCHLELGHTLLRTANRGEAHQHAAAALAIASDLYRRLGTAQAQEDLGEAEKLGRDVNKGVTGTENQH